MSLALLLALAGCVEGPGRQRCRLADERVVATSRDARLGAIALQTSRDGRRALVAWSERDAVRAAIVDVASGSAGEARIVLPGGATALAAALDGEGWRLAAVLPDDAKGGGGTATMLALGPDAAPGARLDLGPAGVHSEDVAILRGPRGWVVAWHDGAPGSYAVRVWSGGPAAAVPCLHACLGPALARDGEGVAVGWADMTSGPAGIATAVRVAALEADGTVGAPRDVGTSTIEGADPALFERRGALGGIFRDEEDGDGRSEYFVAAAERGAKRFRVGRANGRRSPSVVTCHGIVAAAAIRTFQGQYLVGFNRFDERAEKRGGELQIYADGVHFGEVSLACLPEGYAIAYAEEGERSRVLFNRETCR